MTIVRTKSQATVSKVIDLIGTHGGVHLGTDVHELGGIGNMMYAVNASFGSRKQAHDFEQDGFADATFAIVDVVWEETDVWEWYGKKGRVRFGKDGGVSATFGGLIEAVDNETIRVVPRQTLGGLDLGPGSYPSDGQVRISSIRSIEPLG